MPGRKRRAAPEGAAPPRRLELSSPPPASSIPTSIARFPLLHRQILRRSVLQLVHALPRASRALSPAALCLPRSLVTKQSRDSTSPQAPNAPPRIPSPSPPPSTDLSLIQRHLPPRRPSCALDSLRNDSPITRGGLSLARVVEHPRFPPASYPTPFSSVRLPRARPLDPISQRHHGERYVLPEPPRWPSAAVPHSLASATRHRAHLALHHRLPHHVERAQRLQTRELRARPVHSQRWGIRSSRC